VCGLASDEGCVYFWGSVVCCFVFAWIFGALVVERRGGVFVICVLSKRCGIVW